MQPTNQPIPVPPGGDGWNEWGRHVLQELVRLNGEYEKLREGQSRLLVEISMLKVKSGIWGMVGAAVPVAVLLAIQFLKAKP